MDICIEAVATHYSQKKVFIKDLAKNIELDTVYLERMGIDNIYEYEEGITTTEVAARAVRKALSKSNISAKSIDQVAYISEGINDYLYMDTSKSVIRNIEGRLDGPIYSNDYFRGSNGTIGFIKFIGNQVLSNPSINISVINTALIWKNHSNNRFIGMTFMGDSAGAVIIKKGNKHNRIVSMAFETLSNFNLVNGYKYGGNLYDLTKEVVQNRPFHFDILDTKHYLGLIRAIISSGIRVANKVLDNAGLIIEEVDYIGVAGFHQEYTDSLLNKLGSDANIINPLKTKGYLGSVGVIEILDSFINNFDIENGKRLLVIAIGIDVNVEAMIIQK